METLYIVGSGPSLRGFDFAKLQGKTVWAVNKAWRYVPWAEVLFTADARWMQDTGPSVRRFGGEVVTTCDIDGDFTKVTWKELGMPKGGHSGAGALLLAVKRGYTDIVLIGFDCGYDEEGYGHHYDTVALSARHRKHINPFHNMAGEMQKVDALIKRKKKKISIAVAGDTSIQCFNPMPLSMAIIND